MFVLKVERAVAAAIAVVVIFYLFFFATDTRRRRRAEHLGYAPRRAEGHHSAHVPPRVRRERSVRLESG